MIEMNDFKIIKIEKVVVDGDISLLGEAITAIDKTVFEIYEDSCEVSALLTKHFETNKGNQYVKMAEISLKLSNELDEVSTVLDNAQKQIANFIGATHYFNEENKDIFPIRKKEIIKINPDVMSKFSYFDLETITAMRNRLVEFSKNTKESLRKLVAQKNDMSSFWKRDPQYIDFSDFIDEVYSFVSLCLQAFDEYTDYLQQKIRDYENVVR